MTKPNSDKVQDTASDAAARPATSKAVHDPGTPQDPWATDPAGPEPASWKWLWPVLVALALTFILTPLPRLPLGADDDSSWSAVLGYAHRMGLQFGTDIVFTYGPLGFLLTPYYSVATPGLCLAVQVGICFIAMLGLCFVAWRLRPVWRWLLVGIVILTTGNTEPRMELLINLALLSWSLLCLVEPGAPLPPALLVVLAVFGGLGKGTLLFTGTIAVVAVALDSFLSRRRRAGIFLVLGYALCWVAGWLLTGQHLANIGKFLRSTAQMAGGYAAGIGLEQLTPFTRLGLAIIALGLPVLALSAFSVGAQPQVQSRWRGVVRFGWFLAWLFVIWKLGFVRVGRDHIEVFLAFVPVFLLCLQVFFKERRLTKNLGAVLVGLLCVLSLFTLIELFASDVWACLYRPYLNAAHNAKALFTPGAYRQQMHDLQDAEREAMQLPKARRRAGRASLDVFGQRQSYAIFNDFKYKPRPVFQSYAAYTRGLMRRNEAFYGSTNAPQFVLFRLEPIDERFPPLEDALVLRDLLFNYEPLEGEGPFLLLQHKGSAPAVLQYVRDGAVRPGELIDLRDQTNADIWVEIQLNPTLLGRARGFLYQPAPLELGVWLQGSPNLRRAKFMASAPLLAAGFLASPLLLENDDVLDLYSGNQITRPVAYSVELTPATQAFWEPVVRFRIYRIVNQLGRSVSPQLSRLLKFPGFEVAPSSIVAPTNAIVQIGGKPALFVPPGGEIRFTEPLEAKLVRGSLGFAPGAYSLGGATEGAQFRIEEETADGNRRLLYSQTLTPSSNQADRGMKPFTVPCGGEGQRQLILHAVPVSPGGRPWDITCWAGVGFE